MDIETGNPDLAYEAALRAGDFEAAQQLVNQAAEAASPDIFDASRGLGSVPKNQDVNYFGFVKWMTPDEFRALVPPGTARPDTRAFVADGLRAGTLRLGPPFLRAEWDEESRHWRVIGHEGRSRMDAIADVCGQVPVPVHIFPSGETREMRSRDLEMTHRQAAFVPEPVLERGGPRVGIQTSAVVVFRDETGEDLVPLSERFPAGLATQATDDLSAPPNGPGPTPGLSL